jgi:tetratricopeptide (TPR) repeat protein
MYEMLFSADVVIADLSTANPNALYELGVRHALRPCTTIVMSENELVYPFDVNRIRITSYKHLGQHIDFDEALRFQGELGKTLDAVLSDPKPDSPVYEFLNDLHPPELREKVEQAMERAAGAAAEKADSGIAAAAASPADDRTVAGLVEEGELAIAGGRFEDAKLLFGAALRLCKPKDDAEGGVPVRDPYLQQRLVLATLKAKQPDEPTALGEALRLLAALWPKLSNDPETVGLAGVIERRLYELNRATEHLDRAIDFFQRNYQLGDDWGNDVELAFLLTLRADSAGATDNERIADLVWADRARPEVLKLCDEDLAALGKRGPAEPGASRKDAEACRREQEIRCLLVKAEAQFGLGDAAGFEATKVRAMALAPPDGALGAFHQRIGELKTLLDARRPLLARGDRRH